MTKLRRSLALDRFLGTVLQVLGTTLLVLVFLFPIVSFLALAFFPRVFGQGDQWFTLSSFSRAFNGNKVTGIFNSVGVGVTSACLGVGVATLLAWFQVRYRLWQSHLWTVLLWVIFFLPTYLSAEGWQFILDRQGLLFHVFGTDPAVLRHLIVGPWGVVWVLGVRGVSFAYFAIAGAVVGLGYEYEEAVRTHGGGPLAAFKVQIRMLAPALFAAFALVFAESISDFGVASTLAVDARFPISTYTIYQETQTIPIHYPLASAFTWALLLIISLSIFAQNSALRSRSYEVLSGRNRPLQKRELSRLNNTAVTVFFSVFSLVAIGVPVVGILVTSLNIPGLMGSSAGGSSVFDHYAAALASSKMLGPIVLSLELGFFCGTIAGLLGTILSFILSGSTRKFFKTVLDITLLAIVGLPSIVVGIGFIFAYGLPVISTLLPLYGTLAILMLGYIAEYSPIVARMLTGVFAQSRRSMYEAARIHGVGPLRAWLSAILPIILPNLGRAWLFVVGGIVFELPMSDILHPPGTQPLSVAITVVSKWDPANGTAMTVLAIIGTLFLLGLVATVYKLVKAFLDWQRHNLVFGDLEVQLKNVSSVSKREPHRE